MHTVVNVLILLAVVYGGLTLLMFVFQSRLLYLPGVGRDVSTTPRNVGLQFEDVWLEPDPDVRVHGWFVPRADARGVVLILHGNAGSIALRLEWLRMLHDLGYASLIIDYRGYGRSTGSPSEQGTYNDARAAWDHLTADRRIAAGDIVLLGESLGGGVATWLAARYPARALILHSTFTSIPDVAAEFYPFMPVRWITRFDYGSLARMRDISIPVLVAHSPGDELIRYHHGRALYDAARSPKRFIEMSGGHNDAFIFTRRAWVDALAEFLEGARGTPGAPSGR